MIIFHFLSLKPTANAINRVTSSSILRGMELDMQRVPEELNESDRALICEVLGKIKGIEEDFDSGKIKRNFSEINSILGAINKFINNEAPWSLKGETGNRSKRRIVFTSIFLLAQINCLLSPILFQYSRAFSSFFGLEEEKKTPSSVREFAQVLRIPDALGNKKEKSPLFLSKF